MSGSDKFTLERRTLMKAGVVATAAVSTGGARAEPAAKTTTPTAPAGKIGSGMARADGRLKVSGGATYAIEHSVPNLAYGVCVGSTIAAGRITAIDTAAAEKAPGVVAVYTHLNRLEIKSARRYFAGGAATENFVPLVDDEVRWNGQHIAFVVAETFEQATEAAALIVTTYAEMRHSVVPVNTVTPSWVRAPGENPSAYAIETAMDELAYKVGVDPMELRLRNWADQDPKAKLPWSTRRLREAYAAGADAFGWSRRALQPRSMREGHALIGWGMAAGTYPLVKAPGEATLFLHADGRVEVLSAGVDIGMGQGVDDAPAARHAQPLDDRRRILSNINTAGATPVDPIIDPETIDSYEAGLKSAWLDHRLTANLALFWTNDDNHQTTWVNLINNASFLTNAGSVRSRGVELDLRAAPTEGPTLYGSATYDDASYTSYRQAVCPIEVHLTPYCDLSGRRLPGVSLWAASAGGEYRHAAGTVRAAPVAAATSTLLKKA